MNYDFKLNAFEASLRLEDYDIYSDLDLEAGPFIRDSDHAEREAQGLPAGVLIDVPRIRTLITADTDSQTLTVQVWDQLTHEEPIFEYTIPIS